MGRFDINKYRQMFLEESEEIFETIDKILLEAESCGSMDDETINSLFRCVHTLKGNSASVELIKFASLAHEIEFFMDRLRTGELTFEYSMAELLIESVDTLREILDFELSDQLDETYYDTTKQELLHKLESFIVDINEIIVLDDLEMNADAEVPFGLFVHEKSSEHFGLLREQHNSSQNGLDNDDDFGFFDDSFDIGTLCDKEIITLIDSDDSFGFFEEQNIKNDQEEQFGFFDDTDSINDGSFGFFEKDQENTAPKENVKVKTQPLQQGQIDKEVKKFSKTDATSNSIRVDLSKIDDLMNNIGELVIAHSMLAQYAYTMEDQKIKSDLNERLDLIDRYIRELQESIMSVRMIPMETVFSKFPKVIRDTAKKLNKKIDFKYFGETVEIDKAMIEGITDPLMHIVRNALDHGIESVERRKAVGKPEVGTLIMGAEQANGQMIIKIQDDGGGINLEKVSNKAIENGILDEHAIAQMSKEDKALLIFAPGLSTAEAVTDISGRGVGMDVVMSNIKKLGGTIKVDTEEGFGTTFIIVLPLTLAILDGLNIRVGDEQFVLPLSSIIESLNPDENMIKQIGNENSEVLMLRDEFISIVRLYEIFHIAPRCTNLTDGILIVVRSGTKKIALFVDEFMNQQQFVIKPLEKNFRNARGIGGATVRGDGTIGLIIDTMNITDNYN